MSVMWNTELLWEIVDLACWKLEAEGRVLVTDCNVQVFLPLLHFPHWRCFLLHQSLFHRWDASSLFWKDTVSNGWIKFSSHQAVRHKTRSHLYLSAGNGKQEKQESVAVTTYELLLITCIKIQLCTKPKIPFVWCTMKSIYNILHMHKFISLFI